VYLLRSVDLQELVRLLASTRWEWVIPAVMVGPAGVWARAFRWRYLFPPGAEPPGLVAANMIGYMANNVLPLRAGELVRVYVAARRLTTRPGTALGGNLWLAGATLIVERILDSLTLVLILAVLVLFIAVPPALQYAAVAVLAVDAAVAAILLAVAIRPGRTRRHLARLVGRWPRVDVHAERIFDTVERGLEGIRARSHLLPLISWTAVAWLLPAFGAWALLRAVHLDLPPLAGWTVVTFVGFGISIPSAPGYIGVWHAAAVLALSMFGVTQATALGYAILYHASQFVPITLVGWFFLVREHVSLGEAARARPVEPLA
jgi:uncharacterized protein (TIRG00374 family)